jgi:hypothetical protein
MAQETSGKGGIPPRVSMLRGARSAESFWPETPSINDTSNTCTSLGRLFNAPPQMMSWNIFLASQSSLYCFSWKKTHTINLIPLRSVWKSQPRRRFPSEYALSFYEYAFSSYEYAFPPMNTHFPPMCQGCTRFSLHLALLKPHSGIVEWVWQWFGIGARTFLRVVFHIL